MIPGVSRAGATIVARACCSAPTGVPRPSSRSISRCRPWSARSAYDLYKNWRADGGSNTILIAAGFITSFIAGWIVVKMFLDYVSRHGFAVFAWWRIIVGALGLIGLALVG